MSEDRRTIDELKARYELEPDLRDVYVEGKFDSTVLSWLLQECGDDDVAVYEIDTVEVPQAVLDKHGLDAGQKGRVIATCLELADSVSSAAQVTGVVDRDYDRLIGAHYPCPLLVFTDYACMEMYCFNEEVLGRFFHLFVQNDAYTRADFVAIFQNALLDAFLIRAVNQAKKYGMTWLDLDGQCKIKAGKLEFDCEKYIKKYLNKNSQMKILDEFNEKLVEFRSAQDPTEPRHCIQGHDFVCMLAKYIKKAMRNTNLADPDVIERQLISNLSFGSLADEPMFKALLSRVRAS